VQGSDGAFYGTTYYGGTNNVGTVFRISSAGSLNTLYSFTGGADGANPEAGLVLGTDSNFYGTTHSPDYPVGETVCPPTVFKITATGSLTTLYRFTQEAGVPANPVASLVQGSDGNFYGTTYNGGTNAAGSVFKINSAGSLTTLYSFTKDYPFAPLVQGSDGNFYGTTQFGGQTNLNYGSGYGTVFQISPSGIYTNLYSFTGSPADGARPEAALVQGSDGSFYGTTYYGGTNNIGTMFKLTVPLNPPPNQISGVQLSGMNIIFSIPSIAGETYQLQFSSSMTPTNWVNVPSVSVTNSIGALLTLTNVGGALLPQGFYRFDITP
jgi:uncharacterized repeat protein (TIGR03803 family)